MKKYIRIIYAIFAATILLAISCTKTDWNEIEKIKPGFGIFYDSSNYTVTLTKDLDTDTIDYSDLDIRLRYVFDVQIESFTEAGILKQIQDENGDPVETTRQLIAEDLKDTVKVDISSKSQLYQGLTFNPDSIRPGFSFVFKPYIISSATDTVFAAYGDYAVTPDYVNFCTLPDFPLGVYEAHNKATGFKKDVEIRYMEVEQDVWFFVITDFGLDWSNWDDFWYGTNFSLSCPLPGDSRFPVEFAGWGIDLGSVVLEMENDEGIMESRPLRIMPWVYDDETPDIGYYDAQNKQFIFKNVQVKDTWWDQDNHLLDEVTFTYKGK